MGRTWPKSGLYLFTPQDIIGHLAGFPVNGSKQRSRLRPSRDIDVRSRALSHPVSQVSRPLIARVEARLPGG